jgi:hypothetical protein
MKKLILVFLLLTSCASFHENCLFPAFETIQFIAGENKRTCIAQCTYNLMSVTMEHKKMGYRDMISELPADEIFDKAHTFCKNVYKDKKCWF